MGYVQILALLMVATAVVLVVKGWDVRLVLLGAALAIAALAGDVPLVLREFLATFSNEKFVVPICSAMGFAYVLKHTGCDRHLVKLLMDPLRHFRVLLVPGVIASGFIVNIPLVSQTSTAVCLGAVVVPLMRAAGYSMATIGACLLLGASIGGELLNPGAPELLTVFKATGVPTTTMASEYIPPLLFTQLAIAAVRVLGAELLVGAQRKTRASADLSPMGGERPSGASPRAVRATSPASPFLTDHATDEANARAGPDQLAQGDDPLRAAGAAVCRRAAVQFHRHTRRLGDCTLAGRLARPGLQQPADRPGHAGRRTGRSAGYTQQGA